jgi:Domain of unknown function (DUF3291)
MVLDFSAQPEGYHLAQINVGQARHHMDDARMVGFTSRIEAINLLADRSPGFVWRLQSESGNALDIFVSDDPRFQINVSVWETIEALENFVWKTAHAKVYAGKAAWFEHQEVAITAFWWVPIGHEPTPAEGMVRLQHLPDHGPSEASFGWESLPNVKLWQESRCG